MRWRHGWLVAAVFTVCVGGVDGSAAEAPPAVRTDCHGDALPPGARSRLGPLRFRHSGGAIAVAFSPDGKTLAGAGREKKGLSIRFWEVSTGEELCRIAVEAGVQRIAFSPDEKFLYVSNWDIRDIHHTKTLWRYEVTAEGTLINGKIFFDFSFTDGDEALDGIKVDHEGNLFVSAPGGVWVLSPEGKYLGKIIAPERPANMAWGDADGKTLYLTAHSGLYRIRTLNGGKSAGSTLR